MKKEEKIFTKGEEVFYELRGDFFYCSFPLAEFKGLAPEELKREVLKRGRKKAEEMGMYSYQKTVN